MKKLAHKKQNNPHGNRRFLATMLAEHEAKLEVRDATKLAAYAQGTNPNLRSDAKQR